MWHHNVTRFSYIIGNVYELPYYKNNNTDKHVILLIQDANNSKSVVVAHQLT